MSPVKPGTQILARTVGDKFNGKLRHYGNGRTGAWLFGVLVNNWAPDGLTTVWTDDERLALADNGEVATMLGLGSSKAAATSMHSPRGTSGVAFTEWDAILEQVAGGNHASTVMCRRSQKRKAGCFDAIRSDGRRAEQLDLW